MTLCKTAAYPVCEQWRYRCLALSHQNPGPVWKTTVTLWSRLVKCALNSLRPRDAYMRHWTGSSLVQIMACRLWAPSHYLNQCWNIANWTFKNKLQWNFNREIQTFSCKKLHLKMSPAKWHLFCLSPNELISSFELQVAVTTDEWGD